MKFLDTNVFIRYLTGDDPGKAAASRAMLQRVERLEEPATCSESIIAEIVYVLGSPRLYRLDHEEIRARLQPLIGLRGLQLEHKGALLRSLEIFADHPHLDFEDALALAHMERQNLSQIVSYDRGFDGIAGVTRTEP
jgi:predicted nucleic acid-binding protein